MHASCNIYKKQLFLQDLLDNNFSCKIYLQYLLQELVSCKILYTLSIAVHADAFTYITKHASNILLAVTWQRNKNSICFVLYCFQVDYSQEIFWPLQSVQL